MALSTTEGMLRGHSRTDEIDGHSSPAVTCVRGNSELFVSRISPSRSESLKKAKKETHKKQRKATKKKRKEKQDLADPSTVSSTHFWQGNVGVMQTTRGLRLRPLSRPLKNGLPPVKLTQGGEGEAERTPSIRCQLSSCQASR